MTKWTRSFTRLSAQAILALGMVAGCSPPQSDTSVTDAGGTTNAILPVSVTATMTDTMSGTGSTTTSVVTDSSATVATDTGSGTTAEPTTGADPNTTGTTAPVEPTCDDGVQNGDETDIDCGGGCDQGCAIGKPCNVGADCTSLTCEAGMCVADPGCMDGEKTGTETDVDCGGSCGATCEDGDDCLGGDDCLNAYCAEDLQCETPTCEDGAQNGSETDIDCGGSCGPTCGTMEACEADMDCASMDCTDQACAETPACMNTMHDDPAETDLDCGGVCGPTCMDGQDCVNDGDCASKFCDPGDKCDTPDCMDGDKNADETDEDCGGVCGATCKDGEHCLLAADCESGFCDALETCQPAVCAAGMDDNGCQACLKGSCCDEAETCLGDMKCACWFTCITKSSDFDACAMECMLKNKPGSLSSCAASNCSKMDACGAP